MSFRVKRSNLFLFIFLLIAAFLRFYNLMHDAPYFFNPDERNMAGAISQFRLPSNPLAIPICLLNQFSPTSHFPASPAGGPLTASDCNLNPHFFAYGQFPLYLAFFSDQITKHILEIFSRSPIANGETLMTNFPSAIFYLRFYSALSSTLTVLLVYLITKELFKKIIYKFNENLKLKIENLAALSAAFTPGLIQSAHFGTTESLLTFFFLVSIYLSIKSPNHPITISFKKFLIHNSSFIILTSLVLGLSLGTKLTGLFFFLPPFISIMVRFMRLISKSKKWEIDAFMHLSILVFILIGSIFFYILSSPYNFIDPQDFKSAVFGYETDVATGRYPAFYTRQFVNATPLLFQSEKIFPYALGWPIFISGLLGFVLMGIKILRGASSFLSTPTGIPSTMNPAGGRMNGASLGGAEKSLMRPQQNFWLYTLLVFSFLIYLLPNSFLFAKWTRFLTPIFPFFTIFAAYLLYQIYNLKPKSFLINCIIVTLYIVSLLPGLAFMSIYTHPDTRIQASKWIYKNIPDNSYVLSETANVVDIPLPPPSYNLSPKTYNLSVISFDFYHLDENPILFNQLLNHLVKADYIFIPSRRIFTNYTRLSVQYPLITKYYQLLFSGKLGFEETTRISSFPQLSIIPALTAGRNYPLSFPDEKAEETFTVFDHPVIRIYKKSKHLSESDYTSLFENFKINQLKIE